MWSSERLGAICSLRAGSAFKLDEQGSLEGDLPFIKVSDMNLSGNEVWIRRANNWVDREQGIRIKAKPFPVGTTVFAKIGEALRKNRFRLLPQETIIDNNMMGAIPNEDLVDPRFLYYLLSSADLARWATGTALPYFTVKTLAQVEMMIPPHPTQQKISAVLATYDDLIENNSRRIEILEEMAQAIYREWFVEFRYPGHEGVPLVESDIGLIPAGWDVRSFAELGDYLNGFAFKPTHFTPDGPPVIKIKELKAGVTSETPRYAGTLVPAKYKVTSGDLLFSWSAYLDAFIWSGEDGWLNQHLFRVDPLPTVPRLFLFHSLRQRMGEFRARSQGTTMKHIKRAALQEVKTPFPAGRLAWDFEELALPLNQLRSNLGQTNDRLRRTRDLLLPRLISGEVDVSDLDIDLDVGAA